MKNNFSEETRALFIFRYDCDICGSNKNLELHHIKGRVSDSPCNASLLCHNCHYKHHNKKPFTEEQKKQMLQKTFKWLCKIDYKFTRKDGEFFLKHKKYYSEFI